MIIQILGVDVKVKMYFKGLNLLVKILVVQTSISNFTNDCAAIIQIDILMCDFVGITKVGELSKPCLQTIGWGSIS